MRKNNKLYEEIQIYVSLFHGHDLNCEYYNSTPIKILINGT